VTPEHKARPDHKAHKALKVLSERKDHKDRKVTLVQDSASSDHSTHF
jgi:hypothetical protein